MTVSSIDFVCCPDCRTNKFVKLNEFADSYYACMMYGVMCHNPKCIEKYQKQDSFPMYFGPVDDKDACIAGWNKGYMKPKPYSIGGRWTGD
jgi:uncharacterized protein YbaR (Trm112 family)